MARDLHPLPTTSDSNRIHLPRVAHVVTVQCAYRGRTGRGPASAEWGCCQSRRQRPPASLFRSLPPPAAAEAAPAGWAEAGAEPGAAGAEAPPGGERPGAFLRRRPPPASLIPGGAGGLWAGAPRCQPCLGGYCNEDLFPTAGRLGLVFRSGCEWLQPTATFARRRVHGFLTVIIFFPYSIFL